LPKCVEVLRNSTLPLSGVIVRYVPLRPRTASRDTFNLPVSRYSGVRGFCDRLASLLSTFDLSAPTYIDLLFPVIPQDPRFARKGILFFFSFKSSTLHSPDLYSVFVVFEVVDLVPRPRRSRLRLKSPRSFGAVFRKLRFLFLQQFP